MLVISIIISITVISSKGYLISYSINRITFFFNFICIIADCFNLFAILSWVFHSNEGNENLLDVITTNKEKIILIYLFNLSCLLVVIGADIILHLSFSFSF